MRRVILGVAMAAVLSGTVPVFAQSNPFRPVVYVNEGVITQFDIDQRLKFMELLRAPDANRAGAEKALIEDRLRIIAAKQMDIVATPAQIQTAETEFASRGGLSSEQFIQLLGQNGVDPQIFRDFVTAGLVWRDVVRARVVPMVRVSDAEINQEFTKVISTPKVQDVLLSEMIVPAPEGQEDRVHAEVERLAASIHSEGDFAAAARQHSATRSAENGGRLPWTSLSHLPPSLRPIILSMHPGQVSAPLSVQGAVVLFYLRDTRGTVRAGAKDQQLQYLRLRLGDMSEARRVAATLRNCSDLYAVARPLPADRLIEQTADLGQIPADTGLVLATLDENEATVFGGDIVMLCKRTPALLAAEENQPAVPLIQPKKEDGALPATPPEDATPSREQVRDEVFNRKVSAAADAFMAELRADAIIRRP
ncbi:peptidylprolyl isomerase [Paracoccus aminophilus]|uniref:Parvulin-like PPIase n=1 Tax=Paracoccus aminophilus JCM 7686 TaxID=1367847 RepID=S5YRE6_PARAH|nr:peptidylprolyl isomerase [Paracoccus aminophilus]AGT07841.1 PpiC-type peptidyl-prolyl cis-trans isomerase [Paracoccus aminophilus JCM 7686]